MKFVIQRVKEASVKVDDEYTGKIKKGYLVLIGVGQEDTKEEADKYMNNANTVRLKSNITDEKLSTISSIISELSKLLIGLIIVYELMNGNLSIESALIIYNYKGTISCLKSDLSSIHFWISNFVLDSNRTYDILDDNKFPKEKFGNKNISKFKGHIEFKDVNFSYEENTKFTRLWCPNVG